MPDSAVSQQFSIRPFDFSDSDYEALVRIGNTLFPDYPDTVGEIQFSDKNRDAKIKWQRFFLLSDGEIVGKGGYSQSIDMYHPRKFDLDTQILPEFQGKGLGKTLFEYVVDAVSEHDPILLRGHAREDYDRSVRFLTDRGFTEAMRDWESRLDPRAFDPAPFDPTVQKVADGGIVIRSLAELADDPNRDEKLYEMDWTITLDMPATDVLTKPTFEHFQKSTLGNPNFLPDAWFVALDGDNYVGESALWASQASDQELYVGATGVLREYRRRGIATALKMAATGYAKAKNIPVIKTWNAQQNRAMLSINEAMGFEKQPAWIQYEKAIGSGE